MMPNDQGATPPGIPTAHDQEADFAQQQYDALAEPYVEPVVPETVYGETEVVDYYAVQVHREPPASEPVWHRRFMLVEDKLAEIGHWAARDDHHARVCPICTVLRRARA